MKCSWLNSLMLKARMFFTLNITHIHQRKNESVSLTLAVTLLWSQCCRAAEQLKSSQDWWKILESIIVTEEIIWFLNLTLEIRSKRHSVWTLSQKSNETKQLWNITSLRRCLRLKTVTPLSFRRLTFCPERKTFTRLSRIGSMFVSEPDRPRWDTYRKLVSRSSRLLFSPPSECEGSRFLCVFDRTKDASSHVLMLLSDLPSCPSKKKPCKKTRLFCISVCF